ncbi:unnamed protein product [Auanema sp. JU1783]|nr:unnamed protein product [Auanema sp. JU1783]
MNSFEAFEATLAKLDVIEEAAPQPNRLDKTIATLLPHHPKNVENFPKSSSPEKTFRNVFHRFLFTLLEAVQNTHSILVRHELCSAIYILENSIRLIDCKKVYYRVLLAINIFKDSQGFVREDHVEISKSSLFPNEEAFDVSILQLIMDAVVQIKETVGLKNLQDALAPAWNEVCNEANPDIHDIVVAGANRNPPHYYEPSLSAMRVITTIAHQLECSPNDLINLEEQRMETPVGGVEGVDNIRQNKNAVVFEDDVGPGPSSMNEVDQALNAEEMNCTKLVFTIRQSFPDSFQEVSKYLLQLIESNKSTEQLQEEITNLLGFDAIELAISILEHRESLKTEIKKNRQKPVDSRLLGSASDEVSNFGLFMLCGSHIFLKTRN